MKPSLPSSPAHLCPLALALLLLAGTLAHAAPPETGADASVIILSVPPAAESPNFVRDPVSDPYDQPIPFTSTRPALPGIGVSTSSDRLQLFGDIFTPTEITVLAVTSNLAKATRAGLQANPLATGASAYAGTISTALVFDAGSAPGDWPALLSSAPNNAHLGTRLAHQVLPMALDFTRRNPFYDSNGGTSATVSWIERSFVLLPTLHGSSRVAAGSDALRFGVLEFMAGDRHRPAAGRAEGVGDFCTYWLKRAATVTVAELLNAGFTDQAAPRPGRVVATREKPQFPVTLSLSY